MYLPQQDGWTQECLLNICPFNPDIFHDSDFAPSLVTERLLSSMKSASGIGIMPAAASEHQDHVDPETTSNRNKSKAAHSSTSAEHQVDVESETWSSTRNKSKAARSSRPLLPKKL